MVFKESTSRVCTFGHVGDFVLAHCLECINLQLALECRRDTEEVDDERDDGDEAGHDGEQLSCHDGVGSLVVDCQAGVLRGSVWMEVEYLVLGNGGSRRVRMLCDTKGMFVSERVFSAGRRDGGTA